MARFRSMKRFPAKHQMSWTALNADFQTPGCTLTKFVRIYLGLLTIVPRRGTYYSMKKTTDFISCFSSQQFFQFQSNTLQHPVKVIGIP